MDVITHKSCMCLNKEEESTVRLTWTAVLSLLRMCDPGRPLAWRHNTGQLCSQCLCLPVKVALHSNLCASCSLTVMLFFSLSRMMYMQSWFSHSSAEEENIQYVCIYYMVKIQYVTCIFYLSSTVTYC